MKRGCLFWTSAFLLFWAMGISTAKLLPLGDEPRNAAEAAYHREARQFRHFLNSNPIARLIGSLLVYRVSISDMRQVPNSCETGDSGIAGYRDVVATMTEHSLYGLPLRRYTVSCGGAGSGSYRPRPPSRPVRHGQAVELDPPAQQPPLPPPPGVSPPPVPLPPSAAPR